jgi:hypothetical protein
MYNIFKKIFSFGKNTNNKVNEMAKKYDLMVYEIDANGVKKGHPENGIMANSPSEVINIYKLCGQEVQILREYTDTESQNYGKEKHLDEKDVVMDTSMGATGLLKTTDEEQKQIHKYTQKISTPIQHNTELIQPTTKEPIKYITIGGIKCKIENGKLYQKQWLKLSDNEASEVRIISDKNNKILPLTGKHIEVMKWVMVEEENETENSSKESMLING